MFAIEREESEVKLKVLANRFRGIDGYMDTLQYNASTGRLDVIESVIGEYFVKAVIVERAENLEIVRFLVEKKSLGKAASQEKIIWWAQEIIVSLNGI